MTPNKFSFEDFNQDKEGTVLLGNNESCKEQVVGFVRIKMYNGVEKVLENISYIPELKRNLISL